MDKNPEKEQDPEQESGVDREDAVRRLLEEESGDHNTFNPRTGEDPGLLPLTEIRSSGVLSATRCEGSSWALGSGLWLLEPKVQSPESKVQSPTV